MSSPTSASGGSGRSSPTSATGGGGGGGSVGTATTTAPSSSSSVGRRWSVVVSNPMNEGSGRTMETTISSIYGKNFGTETIYRFLLALRSIGNRISWCYCTNFNPQKQANITQSKIPTGIYPRTYDKFAEIYFDSRFA